MQKGIKIMNNLTENKSDISVEYDIDKNVISDEDPEAVNNLLKYTNFELNDNLKKFITVVDGLKGSTDNLEQMIKHIKSSIYNVDIDDNNGLSIHLKNCRLYPVPEDREQLNTVREFKCVVNNPSLKSATENNTILITPDLFELDCIKITNAHYSHADATDLFRFILLNKYTDNVVSYKFNVSAFKKLPKLDGYNTFLCLQYIFGNIKIAQLRGISEDNIMLEINNSYYDYNPRQFLSGQIFPFAEVKDVSRTEDGLIVPKVTRIIPLAEAEI